MMTYKELLNALTALSKEQLNMDVTVLQYQDEYFHVDSFVVSEDGDGILDENHPVLCVEEHE